MSVSLNPLEILAQFPFVMSWRGTWSASEQYIQNDVVVSPLNGSSYILIESSLLSGTDPSVNPNWSELAPSSTGVAQVDAGAGITVVDPTGPIATVSNNGVISVISGASIDIDNTDPQNPIINSTALGRIQAGLGISVTGLSFSPTITNTGVRTLAVGAGLTTDGDPNNPSIGTTAVLSITQGNGILVTGGQIATVTNDGVVSISGGGGVAVDNTNSNAPVITNLGVLSLTGGAGVTVTGTPQNPVISALIPFFTVISSPQLMAAISFPVAPGGFGTLSNFSTSTGPFYDYILNGAPEPAGVFLVDLTSINLFANGNTPVVAGDKVTYSIVDNVTTAPTPIIYNLGESIMNDSANSYPFQLRPCQYIIDIAALRATGFRVPSAYGFFNETTAAILEMNLWSTLSAVYYPTGVN